MTYARSMGVTKSIWRNSDQRLFPVAANALLDALNAAKEAGRTCEKSPLPFTSPSPAVLL